MAYNEHQPKERVQSHRPQDDLPYERRMLWIIRGYRKLMNALDTLEAYAHDLEAEYKKKVKENDGLRSQNEDLMQKKCPSEGTITNLKALVKEKQDIIAEQRAKISMLQRELAEYKKLYGDL